MGNGGSKTLALVGVLAFCSVLVVRAPAALIAPLVRNVAPGIAFQSIDGTIWNARMRGVHVNGILIGDVKANIKPLRLLTGAAAYKTTLSGAAANGSAVLSQSLFGATKNQRRQYQSGALNVCDALH